MRDDSPEGEGSAVGDPAPCQDGDIVAPVATRILQGRCGHIVLTVQADTPEATRMLARACGVALEAMALRVYGERLDRF